jgi:hypothetical protein
MFGTPSEAYIFPQDLFEKAMTAIAIVSTADRFIIAADGRVRLDDEARLKASAEELDRETDTQQKIFPVALPGQSLAYAVTGSVYDPRGFDLLAITETQIRVLSDRKFDDLRSFLRTLAGKIKRAINEAKRCGTLESFPQIRKMERSHAWVIASLYFCGYFNQFACFTQIDFFHFGGDAQSQVNDYPLGSTLVMGSEMVRRRMYPSQSGDNRDTRFLPFIKDLGRGFSADDAVQFARGYIEACSSPLGLEVDAQLCKGIGGHIHIATITKSDGFKWAIEPATKPSR